MNNKSLIISLSLAITFPLFSCKKAANNSGLSSSIETIDIPTTTSTRVETDSKIVNKNMSDYQVVLSKNSTANEEIAYEELNEFFNKATNVTFSLLDEDNYTIGTPVISLGNNKASQLNNVEVNHDDLGKSGYYIKTVGNSLFILDGNYSNGEGILNGVYDFLHDCINYEFYNEDEIYYEEKSTIPLYEYDNYVIPTFDERYFSSLASESSETYRRRLRIKSQYITEEWATFGHTQINNFFKGQQDKHPDWFSSDMTQLCYSAGSESEQFLADKLYEYIKQKPNCTYFMFGQQDIYSECKCEKCEKNRADFAMNTAGLQINYMNNALKLLHQQHLDVEDEYKNKNYRFVVFAYHATEIPPVVLDSNNEYKPYSDKVIPYDDLYFYFAPIGLDYSEPFNGENNISYYNALKGYNALAPKRVFLYSYDTNFHCYMYLFNNADYFTSQLKDSKDIFNINYLYYQGPITTNQPTFQEMRHYVESKLMWNYSLNYEDLANDFMNHFYKQAAPYIKELYYMMRYRLKEFEAENSAHLGSIYASIDDRKIWTYDFLTNIDSLITKGLDSLNELKQSDIDTYTKVYSRVKEIRIMIIYNYLRYYSGNFSQAEINNLKNEMQYYCSLFNISEFSEGRNISNMFE